MNPESIIEVALLTTESPISRADLGALFEPAIKPQELDDMLERLRLRWSDRGLYLHQTAEGWLFRVDETIINVIPHLYEEKSPRYSKAVLETLAVIAYRQPVTRADIEAIRGVSVSTYTLQILKDWDWIASLGHKDAPGKPRLWATTPKFLMDLQLTSLDNLPSLSELGQILPEVSAIEAKSTETENTETESLSG